MPLKFNIRNFLRHTFIYGFSSVLTRVLNFLLTPLYVRSFDPEDYGIIILLFSWAAIINAIISFGMETSFFRFYFNSNNKSKIYTNCLAVVTLLAILFIIITNIFKDEAIKLISPAILNIERLRNYRLYISLFSLIIFLDNLILVPLANLRAKGCAYKYSFVKGSNVLLFILINLIFILLIPSYLKHELPFSNYISSMYKPNWVGYVFIANVMASLLSFLFVIKELKDAAVRLISLKVIKKLVNYSFPIMAANFAFIINENIDKIMLAKLLPNDQSIEQIGIYGACGKIALFLNIAIQAFRLGAEPIFFKHAKERNATQLYANIMLYFTIVVSLIAVGITVNIPLLKYFIKGSQSTGQDLYWSGLGVIPILVYAYTFLGIYMNLSIWYKLSGKTYYAICISGPGALMTILLNLWLIPSYGYLGSAITTLLVYLSMMSVSYFLGQRQYAIPYQSLKICTYIMVSLLISFISYYVVHVDIILGNLILLGMIAVYLLIQYRDRSKDLKKEHLRA